MSTSQVTGHISRLQRLTNSYSGNPRFRIELEEREAWNTAADHSFNYEVGNRGLDVGDLVTLTIGGRGTVVGIERAGSAGGAK